MTTKGPSCYILMIMNETWLIASNPSKYAIQKAFDTYDVITWGLTIKPEVGDIVYIYVSAPISAIKYRCIVDKANVPSNEREGAEFWVQEFDPTRYLVNLRLLTIFKDPKLQLKNLVEQRLIASAPQGPRKVTDNLNKFLQDF